MAMVMLPQSAWEEVAADLKELKEFVRVKAAERECEWIESNQEKDYIEMREMAKQIAIQ